MHVTYTAVPDVIETDLESELILLDPGTQEMFSLNETGRRVWRSLPAREAALVDAVVAAFDVARDTAAADVRRLLAELVEAGLVEAREDAAGAQGTGG